MLDLLNYKNLVDSFYERIAKIPETIANIKISEDKWSLKEIIGHLIDSASNNHQRFVRLQFGNLLDFPAYDGEQWVIVQNYRKMNWSSIVLLWHNYNCMLINIIECVDNNYFSNVWVKGEETISFERLIIDYYSHIKLHIEQLENRLREVEGGD